MVSVSITLEDEEYARLRNQAWVNWSEIARRAAMKREIFERYKSEGKLTKRDLEFCDSIDWHPVDELPIREEYIRHLKRISKEKKISAGGAAELRKMLGL